MTIQQQIQQLNVGVERTIEGVTVKRLARRLWRVNESGTHAAVSTTVLAVVAAREASR